MHNNEECIRFLKGSDIFNYRGSKKANNFR